MKVRDNLKQELLEQYATREPKAFYQIDGSAHGIVSRVTHELMYGSTVRVLVEAGTTEEDALRLLDKIRGYTTKGGSAFHREDFTRKEARLDDDLCSRCGAAMQATHNPLCRAQDGTPTALTDDEVRKVLGDRARVLIRDAEEKPF